MSTDGRPRPLAVDVVVVTYQSEGHVGPCLASLPPVTSVTVVDNASEDASAAVARASGAHIIENDDNRGFAAAANQGAGQGSAPFVLFLNPDAVLEPRCLDSLVNAISEDENLAIVGPQLRMPDGGWQRAAWPFPSAARSWREALGLLRLGGDQREGFVVGACLLVRRAAFEAVGGFDERFWLYGEEADLAYRLQAQGWRSAVVNHAVADHLGGASGDGSDRAFEEFQRGTERFVALHRGRPALVSHRLALFTGSLLRVLALGCLGRWSAPTAIHRRRIVRRLAIVLVRHPTKVPMAAPSQRTLVVLSLEAWDEVWRRNQFLVRELLRMDPSLRVLFVEPPIDVPHHVLRRRTLPRLAGVRPSDHDARLLLVTPQKWLPRSLGRWADRSLLAQLRRTIDAYGFDRATLWVNDPAYAGLTAWRRPLLYDLTDDWTRADAPTRAHRRLQEWDRCLTRHAGVVVACSDDLAKSHAAREVWVIPNAVDFDHVTTPQPRPVDLPSGRCAVYIGTLHEERVDLDMIVEVARTLRSTSFVFVGPLALTAESRRRVEREDNVILLGARPYSQVPAYLQHADVIVVPHVVTPFTESLDPIKAYECRAVGRPVVATPVRGFRGEPWAIVAEDAAAFASAVAEAREVSASGFPPPPTWAERGLAFNQALGAAAGHRPKVVYLDHCALLSGAELALLRLLPSLDVDAHVILGSDGPLVEALHRANVAVEVLPMTARSASLRRDRVRPGGIPIGIVIDTARYVLTLRRRLQELAPDLVHTNSLKAAIYGTAASRLAGVPVLVHARDRIADDYLPADAVRALRLFLQFGPTEVIANSKATWATLGVSGARTVVPSPVVYDAASPITGHLQRGSGAFTVGMVGRLAPWKGQDVFLRAFAAACPEQGRAVLVGSAMFGESQYEVQLHELCANLGIMDRVDFTGFVDEPERLVATFDVLVHASVIPEPFGQVVIEGMAAGRAVVAAGAGGPAEVVTDGVDGWLYPPGDVDALADLLRFLAADPDARHTAGEAARRRAADFAPDRVARQVEGIYEALLARG